MDAIIAGIIKGFNRHDWQQVFRTMDKARHRKNITDKLAMAAKANDIY